ncbi:MAG: hypothetical protein JWN70_135 [Planctomycetaceae bacterium]|nr:hypothetical protein [Planctomycetaceae bacterium]
MNQSSNAIIRFRFHSTHARRQGEELNYRNDHFGLKNPYCQNAISEYHLFFRHADGECFFQTRQPHSDFVQGIVRQ